MGIVTNNKSEAQADKDFDLSFNDGHEIKVIFNAEVLSGCEFKCVGCFVNKLGTNIGSFDRLNNAIDLFNDHGYRSSTINIGPTDIFGNNNVMDLLQDPDFRDALSKVTTIQFVTTLENIDLDVINELNSIPKTKGFMYDANIAIDPKKFPNGYEEMIDKLNLFDDDLNYYIVLNMGNDDDLNERVLELSDIADKQFDTILTLNPSFLRTEKSKVHKHLINKWKKLDDWAEDNFPSTIIDQAQGGSLELNYTYCNGNFFWTPFVYDIVKIGTDQFKVKDEENIDSWLKAKNDSFLTQMMYTSKTDSCDGCAKMMTCIDKGVQSYMEHHSITECLFPYNQNQ
jgi:hypothetical protein